MRRLMISFTLMAVVLVCTMVCTAPECCAFKADKIFPALFNIIQIDWNRILLIIASIIYVIFLLAKDNHGMTAMDYAISCEFYEIPLLFFEKK